jgi:hypothetical protein
MQDRIGHFDCFHVRDCRPGYELRVVSRLVAQVN